MKRCTLTTFFEEQRESGYKLFFFRMYLISRNPGFLSVYLVVLKSKTYFFNIFYIEIKTSNWLKYMYILIKHTNAF